MTQFARLADIPPSEASDILVLLTRANILQVQPSEKEDAFVFRYQEEVPLDSENPTANRKNGQDRYT